MDFSREYLQNYDNIYNPVLHWATTYYKYFLEAGGSGWVLHFYSVLPLLNIGIGQILKYCIQWFELEFWSILFFHVIVIIVYLVRLFWGFKVLKNKVVILYFTKVPVF